MRGGVKQEREAVNAICITWAYAQLLSKLAVSATQAEEEKIHFQMSTAVLGSMAPLMDWV